MGAVETALGLDSQVSHATLPDIYSQDSPQLPFDFVAYRNARLGPLVVTQLALPFEFPKDIVYSQPELIIIPEPKPRPAFPELIAYGEALITNGTIGVDWAQAEEEVKKRAYGLWEARISPLQDWVAAERALSAEMGLSVDELNSHQKPALELRALQEYRIRTSPRNRPFSNGFTDAQNDYLRGRAIYFSGIALDHMDSIEKLEYSQEPLEQPVLLAA